MLRGEAPDPALGRESKQRSVHNTYFTLPVLFLMISNHYAMVTGHRLELGAAAGDCGRRRGGAAGLRAAPFGPGARLDAADGRCSLRHPDRGRDDLPQCGCPCIGANGRRRTRTRRNRNGPLCRRACHHPGPLPRLPCRQTDLHRHRHTAQGRNPGNERANPPMGAADSRFRRSRPTPCRSATSPACNPRNAPCWGYGCAIADRTCRCLPKSPAADALMANIAAPEPIVRQMPGDGYFRHGFA